MSKPLDDGTGLDKDESSPLDKETALTLNLLDEAFAALIAKTAASKRADEAYDKAQKVWMQIEALRSEPSDGDALTKIADLVRRHGSAVANRLGYPGAAVAGTAFFADDGAFTGLLAHLAGLLP